MYIYKAQGICPSEIHFRLQNHTLDGVRFEGGGCKGNAQLICRLLEGRKAEDILPLLEGIQCRNGTSCPDQLYRAVASALRGDLPEAGEIMVWEDPEPRFKVAVLAELRGGAKALRAILDLAVDAVYCLGNLTCPGGQNDAVVEELALRSNVFFARGPLDQADGCERPENREKLLKAPHFIRFKLGERQALGFYGGYIQELQGFSDFSRHSLELLMVSNLSDYLRNEEVFPALAAMTGQFESDLILFAHTGLCRHVRLGDADFVNVGPVEDGNSYRYALLQWEHGRLEVSFEKLVNT